MHSVLGWKTWLLAALALCAALIAIQLALGVEALQAVPRGVSWASLGVTVFVTTPVWRLLWLMPWFCRRAPPLDGVWKGTVFSNWSIIEAMKDGAKHAGAPAIDVDSINVALPNLTEVPVTATIKTSFFGINLELESLGNRYQTSSLKVVEMKPASDGSGASLHYIFEGRVLQPKPGDVTCFDGAASLTVIVDEKGSCSLEGPTWTNRAWSRGLNTAGLIRMTCTERRFWSAATFGLVKDQKSQIG